MAAFLLLSLGALFLLSDAQDAYNKLPEAYRKGVDVALEKVNTHEGILYHFNFYRTQAKSAVEPGFGVSYLYHNFQLKATKCPKGTTDPAGCRFRNDKPLIDCAICYKTFEGEIEHEPKPYVHCIHRPALTEEMKTERVNQCNAMSYSNGAPSLLSSTGNN